LASHPRSRSILVAREHLALGPRPRRPDRLHRGGRLEEPDRTVGERDVAAAGVVAAQAVVARAVPVAIPGAYPPIFIRRVGRQQGIAEGPTEHALVPCLAQVAHVVDPSVATIVDARRREAGARVHPSAWLTHGCAPERRAGKERPSGRTDRSGRPDPA